MHTNLLLVSFVAGEEEDDLIEQFRKNLAYWYDASVIWYMSKIDTPYLSWECCVRAPSKCG